MDQHVYTLADLESRDVLDADHSKPAMLAVIGFPVAHSASPRMHQPALDALEINARYIKVEVPAGQVKEAFSRMKKLGFIGCNVTVPHKFEALTACDEVDDWASSIGAVNTVKFSGDRLLGWNTDGPGFSQALEDVFSFSVSGMRIMIVGAGGGAGQSIATQCGMEHAQRVVLVNRTLDKIEKIASSLRERFPHTIFDCLSLQDTQLIGVARQCQLLVNTSSVGLKPDDVSPIPAECFMSSHFAYDTIYQPPLTDFLKKAKLAGASTASGFSMLLHQGVKAFQIWFPNTEPTAWMRSGLMG